MPEVISEEEEKFLVKDVVIKNKIITPKNLGAFKLSEFGVVTNPIQFDKLLDTAFFSLDSNSKRFVQFIAQLHVTFIVQLKKLLL